MISNSLPAEEEVLFTSPESLEQLRLDLMVLAEQHHRTAPQLPNELAALLASLLHSPDAVLPVELLHESEFQLRERSACVVALAQLATRLVEGMRDQQLQHVQTLDRYERELEALREHNDSLTHRNRHIENDVQYFREHLQNAESQLEHIEALQLEDTEERGWEGEKDRQIEELEGELDRIRAELQFYRLNHASRKSIRHLPPLLSVSSEQCIKDVKDSVEIHQGDELTALRENVQFLAAENERLRNELYGEGVGSRKSLFPLSIREELIEQTQRSPIEAIGRFHPDQIARNPSISRLRRESLSRDTSKSLLSPREQHEDPPHTPLDLHGGHILSSEWSTKSFDLRDSRPKLIFLQEEEEEKQRRVQETKETEESVREAETRKMEHVGVNTDPPLPSVALTTSPTPFQIPSQSQSQQPSSLLDRILRDQSNPLGRLGSLLVRQRIRRSSLRASKWLVMVGC